jgi:choline dehydrogenase
MLRLCGISGVAFAAGCVRTDSGRPRVFDYVIVGAGSAGCALAARLLAHSERSVLLIEAGGSNDRPDVREFAKEDMVMAPDTPIVWPFESEPQPQLLGSRQSFACGKVLGGSSSVNGMVWVRGNPADYDGWAARGCTGWDHASIRPSLDALTGPIHPSNEMTRRNALSQAVVDAAVGTGYEFNPDYNGDSQFGVAYTQLNVVNGIRQDAFTTFLKPYLDGERLMVMTDAWVTRLTFDGGGAVDGVHIDAGGDEFAVNAERAGTVNTAQLLLRSGVGPASDLEPLGIGVVHDLAGVGQNMHDHLISVVVKKLRKPEPATHVSTEDVNVFTGQAVGLPNAPRFEFQVYYTREPHAPAAAESVAIGVMNLHPTSRGYVKLRSVDPHLPPNIQPNFLQTPEDVEMSLEGFELARDLLNAGRLKDWLDDDGAAPEPNVRARPQMLDAMRMLSQSNFHAVGSCRMGTDADAVVDPQLRVHGLTGLRVACAAVMPTITSGNTNAPSMMIGDRCGRLVLG